MNAVGTKMAARILGVPIHRLQQAAWLEKFPPPAKMNGGFIWTLEDLQRASWILLGRALDLSTTPAELQDAVSILTSNPGVENV